MLHHPRSTCTQSIPECEVLSPPRFRKQDESVTEVVWGHPDYGGEEATGAQVKKMGWGVRSASTVIFLVSG